MHDDDPNMGPDDFEEVSDSNEMIDFLLKDTDFDTSSCQENLTKEQKAISHAFIRMIEEHTSQTGFYYRYNLHMPEFCEATQLRERAFMGDKSKIGNTIFGRATELTLLGRLPRLPEQISLAAQQNSYDMSTMTSTKQLFKNMHQFPTCFCFL